MNIELKQSCTACGRSLKIRLEEVPEADFTITCPKCKAEQVVRASDVAAVAGATMPGQPPPRTPSIPPRAPAPPAAPEKPDSLALDSLGFGAQDLTDSLRKKAARGVPPAFVERDGPSLSGSRAVPRNAPRTSPPRGGGASAPLWALVGGGAGGVLLLSLLVWLLWPSSGSKTPGTDIEKDIAAIVGRYEATGAGGEAADLFRAGLELFRSDAYDDHRQAADKFRRALVAAPHHPEPLAALALNSIFLPRSDRDGIGVAQANIWADHVQRVLPESLLGSAARATLLAAMGRGGDAQQLAAEQLSRHSGSAHAWFILGHVQRTSDPKAAAESLRKAVELDPGYRIAQTELAEAELAAGRVRAAAEAIAARERMGPPSSWSERVAGTIAARMGDDAAAIARFENAVRLEPKDVEARIELGWRLAATGKLAEAAAHARHVIEKDRPTEDASEAQTADAKLLLAETQRRLGDAKSAVATARPIIRLHPDRAAAQYLLGLAELASGDAESAAETLRSAAQQVPNKAVVHVALGMAFAKGGHPEDAVGAYLAALEKNRGETLARAGLAAIYADADLSMRALEEWDKMLRDGHALAAFTRSGDPRYPRPPIDLPAHLRRLKAVESIDPNRDSRYRFLEAAFQCEAGRAGEALAIIARERTWEPAHGAFLAGCALAAGRPQEALRLTARTESARDEAIRGWALQAARANGAEASFRRAIQSDPGEPFARLGLARILAAKGKRKEALELLGGAEATLGPVPAIVKARVDAGGP